MEKMIKIYNQAFYILINKLEKICNDEKLLNDYFVELEKNNDIGYVVSQKQAYTGSIIAESVELEDSPLFRDVIAFNIYLETNTVLVTGLNKGPLNKILVSYTLPENIYYILFKKTTNVYFNKVKKGAF